MVRILFLDNREIKVIERLTRVLEPPRKRVEAPLLRPDQPWENGNLTLYGRALHRTDGLWQLWYTVIHSDWTFWLAYAESDDGIEWRKPLMDRFPLSWGKTNIVLGENVHGPAIILDERESRDEWRYKMLAGSGSGAYGAFGPIYALHSPDGIDWRSAQRSPVIVTGPDCPMGLLRAPDGPYAAYHRFTGMGRRVFRSEAWDFLRWSGEPRLVLEPTAGDPPLTQFYGLGSAPYGPYELGTLWIYRVDPVEPDTSVGVQETELAYARSGYAWHRAAQGIPFIPHGMPGQWDQGNLQCGSAPVFLDNEIRFYYAATDVRHARRWELLPQRAGLGMASCLPDRFVALEAGGEPGELCTLPFVLKGTEVRLNARTSSDGWVRAEMCDERGLPLAGREMRSSRPFQGDDCAHVLRWDGDRAEPGAAGTGSTPAAGPPALGRTVCIRLQARKARLYSVGVASPGERARCDRFDAP